MYHNSTFFPFISRCSKMPSITFYWISCLSLSLSNFLTTLVMVWLQTAMGTKRIWRRKNASRAIGSYMATRYCIIQQVSYCQSALSLSFSFSFDRWQIACFKSRKDVDVDVDDDDAHLISSVDIHPPKKLLCSIVCRWMGIYTLEKRKPNRKRKSNICHVFALID